MSTPRIWKSMKHRNRAVSCIGVILLLGSYGSLVIAQDAGIVKLAKGSSFLLRSGERQAISIGTTIMAKDSVLTGSDGAVGIMLRDNTMLSAGPNSVLQMNRFAFDTTTHAGNIDVTVKRGTVAVISGKVAKATPGNVNFSTPTMTLGVRGTEFIIDAGQRPD